MSFCRDKQIKGFCMFLLVFFLLMLGSGFFAGINQIDAVKEMYLSHNRAIASSLLEQGVSETMIANALTNQEINQEGRELVVFLGLEKREDFSAFVQYFQNSTLSSILIWEASLIFILCMGINFFFRKRQKLYLQAEKILSKYIKGDYSCHLPQNSEGSIFQIFASIEELAMILQAKNEAEHKTKEFLKSTISDISHQLKTPLAALAMYQEIIGNEPDQVEIVKEFSSKMGTSLKRMEQLIQSMLKITRLDTGSILFEKRRCSVKEVITKAIHDFTTRIEKENKQIIVDGNPEESIFCDIDWTSEAIANLVKNALDHTKTGDIIRITWEHTPTMIRMFISDNGSGIAAEDIHHIFKRFYRSKHSLDTQGIGLGLPLAKSIIEGQGGLISVQSELNKGTVFTLSFLTVL